MEANTPTPKPPVEGCHLMTREIPGTSEYNIAIRASADSSARLRWFAGALLEDVQRMGSVQPLIGAGKSGSGGAFGTLNGMPTIVLWLKVELKDITQEEVHAIVTDHMHTRWQKSQEVAVEIVQGADAVKGVMLELMKELMKAQEADTEPPDDGTFPN